MTKKRKRRSPSKKLNKISKTTGLGDSIKEVDETLGLGDVVEKVMEVTGVKSLVKFISGEDCGCDKRKEQLNKLGKWFKDTKVKCLQEHEYDWLSEYFKDKKGNVIQPYIQSKLIRIFNRVFSQRRGMSNCSPCVKDIVDKLEVLYKNYS